MKQVHGWEGIGMQISWIIRIVIGAMALVALVIATVLRQHPGGKQAEPTSPEVALPRTTKQQSVVRPPPPVLGALESNSPKETPEPPAVDYDCRRVLQEAKPPPKLPRDAVAAFLENRQRSAESLLAAYHALEDTNLLAEAAARFPNDPRVQWSVLSRDLFPEERRKWLELFKASTPDNALANYLFSQELLNNHYQEETGTWLFGPDKLPLQDYLKTPQYQAAINELIEATGKPLFKDYTREARLDEEELNLAAGRSVLQSRLGASGWSSDLLPELAKFKSIAICLQEFETAYLSAGDIESAQNLVQIGLTLANRLRSGESGNLVINQLVGTASEALLLRPWEANTSYEFLGGQSPADRQAELKAERAAIRDLERAVQTQLPTLEEADLVSLLDRQRIYGEVEALRWLRARAKTAATPSR